MTLLFISDEVKACITKTTGIKKSKVDLLKNTKNEIIVANMNPLEVGMLTKGDKEKLCNS